MNTILIRDRDKGSVDALILSETVTQEKVNEILAGVIIDVAEGKEDNDYLSLIKQRLPADCEFYDRYSGKLQTVWY